MQPKLFEKPVETVDIEKVLLYALGDFQSRGKVLVNRELAFDRLRGAFMRAFAKFGIAELPEEQIVAALRRMGTNVTEVPTFIAKHPFRLTISRSLADEAKKSFSLMKQNAA